MNHVTRCMICEKPLTEMPSFCAGVVRVRCVACQMEPEPLTGAAFRAREQALTGKGKGRKKGAA